MNLKCLKPYAAASSGWASGAPQLPDIEGNPSAGSRRDFALLRIGGLLSCVVGLGARSCVDRRQVRCLRSASRRSNSFPAMLLGLAALVPAARRRRGAAEVRRNAGLDRLGISASAKFFVGMHGFSTPSWSIRCPSWEIPFVALLLSRRPGAVLGRRLRGGTDFLAAPVRLGLLMLAVCMPLPECWRC